MDFHAEALVSPAEIFVRQFGGMKSALVDWNYTRHFAEEFDDSHAHMYHRKFYVRFEKNVKHRQQVDLIRKYLGPKTLWMDAPIGSGRLMDELPLGRQMGFDLSPAFLEYNRAKGREVIEGDLLDFPFRNRFDIITTLHTLPAFTNYREILVSLVRALRPGGVLIADINNAAHTAARRLKENPSRENRGMNPREIRAFFARLKCETLEILPHDFYDSPFVSRIFRNPAYRFLNRLYFQLRLYPLLNRIATGRPDHLYTKYLLVVRKPKGPLPRLSPHPGPDGR